MFRNPCLRADAYTISSEDFASPSAKRYSGYNMVNRYSPMQAFPDLAKDSRMVMYGLQDWLEIIDTPVTHDDVFHADKFMKRAHSFGGHLPFPTDKWHQIVDAFGGKLPIQINALREGSTFFPNEPFIQVKNTQPGFGEFAALIEKSILGRVSIATAGATLCRHWLERMREQVKIDLDLLVDTYTDIDVDANARFQIHNFGSRACITDDESIILGKGHLLSFHGTDNFDAAYDAWMNGAQDPTGTSIIALAHRNVQGWTEEDMAFQAGINALTGQSVLIISLVADCYDYYAAVRKIVAMAKLRPDVIHVIRPDSGEAYNVLSYIFSHCVQEGVVTEHNGYKLPLNVRFIYGDSVKPKKQFEVMSQLRLIGMLPTQWGIWGVGGYIRNTPTRDSLSSAYKLCYTDDQPGVVKLSETATKLSIPYRNHVIRYVNRNETKFTVVPYHIRSNRYTDYTTTERTIWANGVNFAKVFNGSFADTQYRVIKQFDSYKQFAAANPNFGLNRETLHPNITELQDKFYKKHRGE